MFTILPPWLSQTRHIGIQQRHSEHSHPIKILTTRDSNRCSFYINAPGVSSDEGCHWGDDSKPIGNWAPYVAGANTDGNDNTFVKLGINPVYQDSDLYNTKPTFGLEIECDGDCNGLPCKIDGNGVVSNEKATGAGGSDFCVVTVSKGGKASIVVYNLDGSGGDDGDGGDDSDDGDETSTTSSAEPTSTYPASTSTPELTTTSTSLSTSTSVPSTTSAYSTSSSSSETPKTTTSTSTSSSFTSAYPVFSSSTSTPFFFGGVYHQNETSSGHSSSKGPASTSALAATATSGSPSDSPSENGSESAPTPTESSKTENAGPRQDGAAVAGLVVAFVAAVYLL